MLLCPKRVCSGLRNGGGDAVLWVLREASWCWPPGQACALFQLSLFMDMAVQLLWRLLLEKVLLSPLNFSGIFIKTTTTIRWQCPWAPAGPCAVGLHVCSSQPPVPASALHSRDLGQGWGFELGSFQTLVLLGRLHPQRFSDLLSSV